MAEPRCSCPTIDAAAHAREILFHYVVQVSPPSPDVFAADCLDSAGYGLLDHSQLDRGSLPLGEPTRWPLSIPATRQEAK